VIALSRPAGPGWASPTPQVVGVEITGRCQLRCRHCFNHSGPENAHELPLALVVELLDEMVSWGVSDLRVSGGEPTLHADFWEIVDAAVARGIRLSLNSNGLYTPRMLERLCVAPIALFLISLDGDAHQHEQIRGPGTFARTVEAIGRLRAAGQAVVISFHVSRDNREDLDALAALAARIGAELKVSPIRAIGRAATEFADRTLRPEEFLGVVRAVQAARGRWPSLTIRTDFDILGRPRPTRDGPAAEACKAGRSMVNVHYDGGIYPCAFFTNDPEFAAGDLHAQTVSEVWPTAFAELRGHRKDDACTGCGHFRGSCAGGCPAVALAEAGALDALDPGCFAHLLEVT